MGVIRIVLWRPAGPPDSNRGLALLDVVPHAAIADCVKLDQVYGAPQELLEGFLEIQKTSTANSLRTTARDAPGAEDRPLNGRLPSALHD
jgi:hypothetical protein